MSDLIDIKTKMELSDSQGIYFKVGSCKIIFGPMFSFKSTELVKYANLYVDPELGLSVLYINHSIDVRDTKSTDRNVTTHSSNFGGLDPKVDDISSEKLANIDIDKYDVICIDEGQFFEDIVTTVRKWVLVDNKKVIIACLDGDYKLTPFGNPENRVHNLISICDPGGITKLGAVCKRCMKKDIKIRHHRFVPAGFTMRTSKLEGQVLVGAEDAYEPVCLECYKKYNTH